MNDNESNPYAAPVMVNESVPNVAPLSVIATVAVGIAAVCYVGFTVLWIISGTPEVTAGRLFLINAPVFVFWMYSLLRLRRLAFIAGLSTVFVQAAIMMFMLYTDYRETKIVIAVNGGIMAVLLFLAWLLQVTTRKKSI